jgi:hypothetical protein
MDEIPQQIGYKFYIFPLFFFPLRYSWTYMGLCNNIEFDYSVVKCIVNNTTPWSNEVILTIVGTLTKKPHVWN